MGKLLNYVDGTHINYILSMSSSVLKTFVNRLFYESFDIVGGAKLGPSQWA